MHFIQRNGARSAFTYAAYSISRRDNSQLPCKIYDQAVQQGLVSLWEAPIEFVENISRRGCRCCLGPSKNMAHGLVETGVSIALLVLSAATMNLLLAPTRRVTSSLRTPLGSLHLRRKMPLRTFADWGGAHIVEMEMESLLPIAGP